MRVWMMITALAAALAAPIAAQETRVAAEDHAGPPATLEQMSWLVRQWSGAGIGDAPAWESWLPPTGDTMVGTFVQQTAGGGIRFTEHLYLMEEEGTLVLRLKHFNADLTGWEDKDDILTFPLVAIEECAAYFNALTLRCDGENGLLAAVRMKSDSDEISELVFRFTKSGGSAPAVSRSPDAATTLEINQCLMAFAGRADARRSEYLAAVLEERKDRPDLVESIRASDAAFIAYRDAECGSVYQDWIDGSIRGAMAATCRIDMTDERTHRLWQTWLAGMEPSSAVLPEPGPTR
jgi:uncharacterized protein YecT (DUF1311 family)